MSDFHATASAIRVERLALLRQAMANKGVSALIIPSADPHMSEYLPVYWQGRAWLSGFTGSVGTLVVTADFAGLWADSRYWVQAPIQLDGTGIELMKIEPTTPTFAKYLADTLPAGSKVAIDGAVLSFVQYEDLTAHLSAQGVELVTDIDVLNEIWVDRPALPVGEVYVHDEVFVDTTTHQKLTQVREAMGEKGANFHLISSLDDIAWLTNLRGADVNFNPVFLSHLLISQDTATLFVDEAKLNNETKTQLAHANITVQPYEAVQDAISQVAGKLLIDPAKVAVGTLSKLSDGVELIKAVNPSTLLKAVKSDNDLVHIRNAMRQDGRALCEFFAKFESRLANGERLSELDVDTMLDEARSAQAYHVSASFDTIAGFADNGAIVHYKATEDSFKYLDGDGLLLIDSGAQYKNGTTDITRMAGVGYISDEQKRDVTYVLKAHIALAMAHFPAEIPSAQLDVLARNQMWQYGLDYGHGTGHGVGYFLNVHEGPQVIARTAPPAPERVIKKGMITSNEPGLYRTGKWGIRLENLVVAVHACTSEYGEFLKFEDLTLCPFDTRLLLTELLTDTERAWLNAYHKRVRDELTDGLSDEAKAWLLARTEAV